MLFRSAGLQGSGKTALLETAAGLQPALAGEVRLCGQRVAWGEGDGSAETRRRIGIVFEGGGRLFQRLTTAENIALPLQYHRNAQMEDVAGEVAALMEGCGLPKVADWPANRLGRGWQQRVALARALALGPEILLLDNPLAGLDSVHTRWWRTFLQGLISRADGVFGSVRTVVVACDDLRPWMDLGRQFALANNGRWKVLGSRSEVLANPSSEIQMLLDA
mgnify:CR=1 FL=1